MSKYVFIEKGNKSIDELAKEFQKVFYKKATLIQMGDIIYLQSYNTIVAAVKDDKLLKLWDGYSETTSRHIYTFCHCFGVKSVSKKEWEKMPIANINEPVRKNLNFNSSYFNPYSSRCYFYF